MKTKPTIRQRLAVLAFCGICLATAYAATPPSATIICKVNGRTLTLSWPTTGWILQTQTNSLHSGLGSNWISVPGSQSTTNMVITINPANPAVFYRLVYP